MAFVFRRAVAPLLGSLEVATASGVMAVDVRRHPRARNYTLRVAGPARAPVLTVPKRGSLSEAQRFLDRHIAWLERQVEKQPAAQTIAEASVVPLRGVPHIVRHAPGTRGTVTLVPSDISGMPALVVAGDAAHLRRRVIDFMKREAKRDLEWAVVRHTLKLGIRATAVRLRDQSTRWGSCSPNGHLSFSWRLILAPPFVLDYLAAHEVAHLCELNHSHRFWRLCEALAPQSDQARAWLRANGPALHAVGAA